MTNAGKLAFPVPWLALVALAAFWFVVVRQLGAQWSVYAQYNYGWAVPFLSLYLFGKRWGDRPEAVVPRLSTALALTALCALLFLPTRVVEEASPTWRVPSWAMACELAGLTLGIVYLAGGRAWLKHFAFPVAFFLVAVPWPSQWENSIVQNLMRTNAGLVVEALTMLGIPALQHGNVIEINTGLVGIEEACSGIRSLQATLMISLFFGELYRLSSRRRLGLVLSGAALAFVCNMARTSLLVWVCTKSGPDALEKWHDPTGISILLVCFTGLWLVSVKLRPALAFAQPAAAHSPTHFPHVLPRFVSIGMIVWLGIVEAGTEVWFRVRESRSPAGPAWSVRWPVDKPNLREVEISRPVRLELKFNEGRSAWWSDADGSAWQLFYFRWGPARNLSDRVLVQFAKAHRPEVCLPAAGLTLKADRGIKSFDANGISLPFRAYYFEDRGLPLYVYFCAWEEGTYGAPANMRENTATRLAAAWAGNRSLSQRVIEIAAWGQRDAAGADAALQQQLKEIIAR